MNTTALCFKPERDSPLKVHTGNKNDKELSFLKTELSRIRLWGKKGDDSADWGPPEIIEPTDSYRYLGIELDLTLKFGANRAYVTDKLGTKKNKIEKSFLYGELGRNTIECVMNGVFRYHSAAMFGTKAELDKIETNIRAGLRSVLKLPPGTATAHLRRPDEYMGEGLTSVQQITRENAKKQIVLALREVNRAGPLMKALTNTYALRFGTSAHAPFGRDGGAIIPHPKLAKYTWARRLYEISQEDCAILDVNAPKLDTSLTLFQILVQTEGHLIKENQYPRHPLQKESQEKHYKNIYARNIKNIAYKLQPLWELGLTHVHQIWEKGRPREVREIIIERNNQDNDKEFNKECIVLIERRRKALEYVTGVLLPEYRSYTGSREVCRKKQCNRQFPANQV